MSNPVARPRWNVVNPQSQFRYGKRLRRGLSPSASPAVRGSGIVSFGVGCWALAGAGVHSESTSGMQSAERRMQSAEFTILHFALCTLHSVGSVFIEVALDRLRVLRLQQREPEQHARLLRVEA